jgi:hypothetical protein
VAKLQTETNTPNMHIRVRNAFRRWALGRHVHLKHHGIGPVSPTSSFEHGQLWITCCCDAQWSAVDAVGGDAVDGFSFEQVSKGATEE